MHFADQPRIAVIGLGYVGLPLAVALAEHFATTGLDIDSGRVAQLRQGHDCTREINPERLAGSTLIVTDQPHDAKGADVYIITAPTPVDEANRPDLSPLLAATESVAGLIDGARTTIIIYESTVYPGVTEDICGPLIERISGLERGRHFFLAYSPERVNPGDREHGIERIVKVVAGENEEITAQLASVYGVVTSGGIFKAASIKTAEAAKVIENAQRDINIAFMNEITQIFARIDLSIWDVLAAARTKWNFLPFQPGLVGGHCIGVDPYYLSHRAQELGLNPQVILSGRSINDGMGRWVADRIHDLRGRPGSVLIMGLAFKENVPDLRNTRVVDVIARLKWLGYEVRVHDPIVDPADARHEYGVEISAEALNERYDVVVLAVPHEEYACLDDRSLRSLIAEEGLLADLKNVYASRELPGISRWTL